MVISEDKTVRKLEIEATAIVHNTVIFGEHLTFRTDHLALVDAVAYGDGLAGATPVGFVDDYFRCLGSRCGVLA